MEPNKKILIVGGGGGFNEMMKWVQGKQDNIKIDHSKHERLTTETQQFKTGVPAKKQNQSAMRNFVRRNSRGR